MVMDRLPPRVADALNAPLIKMIVGNITKPGLRKLPYGPLEQIQKDQRVPLLDIGTVKLIRKKTR
jgi:indole-3-pyruvate monooxygenase